MTDTQAESVRTIGLRLGAVETRLHDLLLEGRSQRVIWDNILRASEQTAHILGQELEDRRAREAREHELEMARTARNASVFTEVWATFKGPLAQLLTVAVGAYAAYTAMHWGVVPQDYVPPVPVTIQPTSPSESPQ